MSQKIRIFKTLKGDSILSVFQVHLTTNLLRNNMCDHARVLRVSQTLYNFASGQVHGDLLFPLNSPAQHSYLGLSLPA